MNRIYFFLLFFFSSLLILSPTASASTATESFCSGITLRNTLVANKVAQDKHVLQEIPAPQADKLETRQLAWDQINDNNIHALELATTDKAHLKAISLFKIEFHAAVEEKRAASQAALVTYTAASTPSNNSSTLALRGQALLQAISTASKSCKEHTYSDTKIRSLYNQATRDAQTAYRTSIAQERSHNAANFKTATQQYLLDEQNIKTRYQDRINKALSELRGALH